MKIGVGFPCPWIKLNTCSNIRNKIKLTLTVSHAPKNVWVYKLATMDCNANTSIKVQIYWFIVPKKPIALLNKCLSRENKKIGFRIDELSKSLGFWDNTVVYLGVCLSSVAKKHKFTDLPKEKNIHMISSSGNVLNS